MEWLSSPRFLKATVEEHAKRIELVLDSLECQGTVCINKVGVAGVVIAVMASPVQPLLQYVKALASVQI